MEVHNLNGTSKNKCKCGSWKAHWEKFNDKGAAWPALCREVTCCEPATDGAHVQKEKGADKKWYIIPLCAKHNGPEFHGKTITIMDSTAFASANRSETCEKENSK